MQSTQEFPIQVFGLFQVNDVNLQASGLSVGQFVLVQWEACSVPVGAGQKARFNGCLCLKPDGKVVLEMLT